MSIRNDFSSVINKTYDLIIIGGGITGCGIALDAVSRGLSVALIEKKDIASGTSSRSTKLIHGGLRYLKQFEFGLVKETGQERAIVQRLAPHITQAERMLLPIVKNGTMSLMMASIGTWVYDFLAGVSKNERRKVLTKDEVLQFEPLLKDADLVGGVSYYEYRTDDARLTLAIALEAQKRGVDFFTYALCEELIYDNNQVSGVVVKDQMSNVKLILRSKVVVNATGPWVDDIDAKDYSTEKDKLFLTKGVHIVFKHSKFPIQQAMYFDVEDKRMIFAIPRENCTYVGTTDTAFNKELDRVTTLKEDSDYLLKSINKLFPDLKLTTEDIIGSWAGLRPLIRQKKKSPSAISRKDELFINKSGLITIAGGKLTGYRKMAERTVDVVCAKLNQNKSCITQTLLLHGSDYGTNLKWSVFLESKTNELIASGISSNDAKRLVTLLGSKIDLYINLYQSFIEIKTTQLPKYYRVFMLYTVKYEMAKTLEDILVRRSSDWYFRHSFIKQYENEILDEAEDLFYWNPEDRLNAIRFLNTPIIDLDNL